MSALQGILRRYGQNVVLKRQSGEKNVRAFLQPDTGREECVPGEQTAIGWVDVRTWRYIGVDEVAPGDVIVWNGTAFRVRSSRAYALGDAVHHWWASLEREREAAQ